MQKNKFIKGQRVTRGYVSQGVSDVGIVIKVCEDARWPGTWAYFVKFEDGEIDYFPHYQLRSVDNGLDYMVRKNG